MAPPGPCALLQQPCTYNVYHVLKSHAVSAR